VVVVGSDAPWTRYDDTRITRTTWKGLKAGIRNSANDTAYILFYKRVDAAAQSALNRLPSAVDAKGKDAKSAAPNAPPPEVAAAAAPAAADSPLALPSHTSASLSELIRQDNARYMDELSAATTTHFWQHVNAMVRSHTRYAGEWSVHAPASASASASPAPAPAPAEAAKSKVCPICRGVAHGGSCPYENLVVQSCPTCHAQLPKAQFAAHFVADPNAPGAKRCVTLAAWGTNLTLPEPDPAKPIMQTASWAVGSNTPTAPVATAPPSAAAPSGSGSSGGDGVAPAPPLVRASSVYSCPGCNAVIAGMADFAAHLAKTGRPPCSSCSSSLHRCPPHPHPPSSTNASSFSVSVVCRALDLLPLTFSLLLFFGLNSLRAFPKARPLALYTQAGSLLVALCCVHQQSSSAAAEAR
jgi:hypothetical protein